MYAWCSRPLVAQTYVQLGLSNAIYSNTCDEFPYFNRVPGAVIFNATCTTCFILQLMMFPC